MQSIQGLDSVTVRLSGDIEQDIMADSGQVALGFSDGTLLFAELIGLVWRITLYATGNNSIVNVTDVPLGNDLVTIQSVNPLLWCSAGNATTNPDFTFPLI